MGLSAANDPGAIRAWRKQHRLTQIAAANLFRVSRRQIIRWEKGDYPIPPDIAPAMEEVEKIKLSREGDRTA